jgi:hypothetical protein
VAVGSWDKGVVLEVDRLDAWTDKNLDEPERDQPSI